MERVQRLRVPAHRSTPSRSRCARARRKNGGRLVCVALLPLLSLAALSACTAQRPARPAEIAASRAPERAESVFLTRRLAEQRARDIYAAIPGPEFARRDATLNHRPPTPILASDDWPQPARASGEFISRFRTSPSARSFTFFRGPGYERFGHRRGGRASTFRPR